MAIPAFRGRALVATLMLCGFIALITSGVILYAGKRIFEFVRNYRHKI